MLVLGQRGPPVLRRRGPKPRARRARDARRFLESRGHTDPASVEAWLRLAFPLYTRPRDPDAAKRAVRRPEVAHWFTRPRGEGHTFNLLPQLSRVQCPTLVLGGEDDPMTPIECQADIAAALPAHLGSLRALRRLRPRGRPGRARESDSVDSRLHRPEMTVCTQLYLLRIQRKILA